MLLAGYQKYTLNLKINVKCATEKKFAEKIYNYMNAI